MLDDNTKLTRYCFTYFSIIDYSGCDTRNAVLVVNSIALVFYLVMVVSFSLLIGDTLNYDDDQVQSVMDTLDNAKIGLTITTFVGGIVCNCAALYGAFNFNKSLTFVGGSWFLFETIRSLFVGDLVGLAIAASFCYPHAVFYYELKNGVMSRENYAKEKICCDCCCTC
jgi:hypothetical protein